MPVIHISMKPKDYPFSYCLDPQRIINPYNGETLVVPCGHCEACAQIKSSRYVFQLNCECEASMYNYFVTLTFANRFIPRMVVSRNLVCQDKTVSGFNLYDYYSGVHLALIVCTVFALVSFYAHGPEKYDKKAPKREDSPSGARQSFCIIRPEMPAAPQACPWLSRSL